MSSANFYSGYNPEKPTSKVLAPPGGRSNDIFGTNEPVKHANPHQNTAQEVEQNKANEITFQENKADNMRNHRMNNTSSILFGDDSTANAPPAYLPNNRYQADRMKSNIFEDQSNSNSSAKNRQNRAGGYNPITGQSYEGGDNGQQKPVVGQEPLHAQVPVQPAATKAEEQQSKPLHTSSRVLQPPGGKSTSLW